jgi:hypothetical protein
MVYAADLASMAAGNCASGHDVILGPLFRKSLKDIIRAHPMPFPETDFVVKNADFFSDLASDILPWSSMACSDSSADMEKPQVDEDSDGSTAEPDPAEEPWAMMLCNLPCRLSLESLIEAIDAAGFAGTYSFLSLPGRHPRKDKKSFGYAFVTFTAPHHAERFARDFQNFEFPNTSSAKKVEVKYAHRMRPKGRFHKSQVRWMNPQGSSVAQPRESHGDWIATASDDHLWNLAEDGFVYLSVHV